MRRKRKKDTAISIAELFERAWGPNGDKGEKKMRTFAGDKGYEFAHAFLHAFLGLLGNLGVLGEGQLHDARHWSKVADVSVQVVVAAGFDAPLARRRIQGRGRRLKSAGHDRRRAVPWQRAVRATTPTIGDRRADRKSRNESQK